MRSRLWIVPLVALVLAALACSGPSTGGGDTGGDNAPKVLYREAFEDPDSNWGTGTDDSSSVEYEGGEYVFKVFESNLLTWGTADERDYSNIRMTVTARNIGASADPMFGFICNYQDDQNFYYMGVGSDGYYGISRFVNDEETILTDPGDQWLFSEQIEQNKASYALQADCGNGRLVLYADGKEIASAQDSSFTHGNIGLYVLSFDGTAVEVHFDNLVVTEMP